MRYFNFFRIDDILFKAALLGVLRKNVVDSYMSISTGKDMWDALEAKFVVLDARSVLYVM